MQHYMVAHTHVILWFKVEKRKTVKISWFKHKNWLEIVQYSLEMGVEEMVRDVSCFVTLFHVKG